MTDIHITRELLAATARGELPARMLTEIGVEHLTSLCPTCREEFKAYQREQQSAGGGSGVIRTLPAVLERHSADHERKQAAALRDLRALLRIPLEQRLEKIRRANRRFRGLILAGMFLDESKRHMPASFAAARELAQTAEAVLRYTTAGSGWADLAALTQAYLGNVARVEGNPRQARKCFSFARFLITNEGVTDPLIYAELDSCEAMLYIDQRRFDEAESLLSRSITFYSLAGERSKAAHPLLSLGTLYYNQGDSGRAIEMTRIASDLILPETDPKLYLFARHNLALYLCESGRWSEADSTVGEDRELYGQFADAWTQIRLRWLEGRIAPGLGDATAAEGFLSETRDRFIAEGWNYDAALVSLELAARYVEEGRTGDLKRLVEAMYPIFEAEEVHREALAALLLFRDAVHEERITLETVQRLRRYLEVAKEDPSLRFVAP